MAVVPASSRSHVEISLPQIAENYRAVRAAVGPDVELMPVVKADAYGHGAIEVARVVAGEGARWLAVSCVEEGVALRDAGLHTRVLIMAGVMPYEWEAVFAYDLTPVLHDVSEIAHVERLAASSGRALKFHLKIDSGMSRLGTRAPAAGLIEPLSALRAARFEGLMSHFASPSDFTSAQTDGQIEYFESVRASLAAVGIEPRFSHLASTNAIAYGRAMERTGAGMRAVRPGHALYGYVSPAKGPAPRPVLDVKPALIWKTKVVAVKDVSEGTLVGYGGTYRAAHAMRIAVLAVGYADGFPHRLSNKGKVIAGGRFAPIIGTVSMDLTTVDVTQSPELRPGDTVTLLGREGNVSMDAQQIARIAGTISYNVLCGIGQRVKRVYV